MTKAVLLHLPEEGGALDQNPLLLKHIRTAHRVWWINEYKLIKRIPYTDEDVEFMRWLLGDEVTDAE